MNQGHAKRFAIIGLPGSGKSTFATLLGETLDIPVHHLDKHMFEKDGKKKDKEGLLSIERSMTKEEAWVIEGCSLSTLETRFARATDVIYFRFPRLLCLWRILKRFCIYDKALSNTGCVRAVNWRLIKYIWKFEAEKGKGIETLASKYPQVRFHIFTTSREAQKFLSASKARFL